ncbi:hypothetical protein OIU77_016346 [Salix suchowensis]|uniref:Uncharacterized protein n=1 Tax=Salix suchowensis TaxID=1278906 RepID=A0ABQ8ZK84_9ROSI|nr:hypothetical protein OIU77_016346 [Salix suchowensis]
MAASPLQSSGMLSREQLLYLFNSFSQLTSQPDVKKRIADAVNDKQEAVAATTAIQESIFLEMGVGESVPFVSLVSLNFRNIFFQMGAAHFQNAGDCFVGLESALSLDLYVHFVDPSFGISCLGKVNAVYENDQELMICFYKFVANIMSPASTVKVIVIIGLAFHKSSKDVKAVPLFFLGTIQMPWILRVRDSVHKFRTCEEMACNEAEHGPDEFAEKMHYQQKLQEQQLEMLKYMRKFHLDDQSAILEKLRQEMENANFEDEASVLSPEQIQEGVQRRVSPLFKPSEASKVVIDDILHRPHSIPNMASLANHSKIQLTIEVSVLVHSSNLYF